MYQFDHERLDVYRESVAFVAWASQFVQAIAVKAAVKDHLDRASTSIVLNVAEGNGRFGMRDRCRFLDIAYGSGIEYVACLDVLVAKGLATHADITPGRQMLGKIISMLVKLKQSLANRVAEERVEYLVAPHSDSPELIHEHEYEEDQRGQRS